MPAPGNRQVAAMKVQLLAASHSYTEEKTLARCLDVLPGDHVHIKNLSDLPNLLHQTLNSFADR